MQVVLEINDAGLMFADANRVWCSSPGVAVVSGEQLQVGHEALASVRLNPRMSFDRFWCDLDEQALSRPAASARHNADLAWYHLSAFWHELRAMVPGPVSEVFLAVPANFGIERLSLLLGICQSCEIPVAGVVESSVAAAASVAGDEPRLVLDVDRHRLYASEVSADGKLEHRRVQELAKYGLAWCEQRWVHSVAAQFLRETRFDPLHAASAEQRLFDQLAGWMSELRQHDSVAVELPAGQRRHRIEIHRASMSDAVVEVSDAMRKAVGEAKGPVLVSHRLADWPDLESVLGDARALCLEPHALATAVLAHADSIRSDPTEPAFVTRLPGSMSGARSVSGSARLEAVPTHVLWQSRAWPVARNTLLLNTPPKCLVAGESAHGVLLKPAAEAVYLELPLSPEEPVTVNGKAVAGQTALHGGDVVTIGEARFQMITVLPGG